MRRMALALLLFTLVAAVASADEVVRCESKGNRRKCAFDTPGSVSVSVKRQLSIIECVEGSTWGWRNGEIWVDNGCRGDFLVERHFERRRDEGQTLVCESNGGYHHCDARVPFGVRLERQISRNDCIRGRSWDYDRNGVWVDRGCRAEFFIEGDRRRDDDRGGHNRERERERDRERVLCESRDARTTVCAADTRYGVELSRQLSTSECVFRRSWGYNDRGIWVKDGCRAEFVLGR